MMILLLSESDWLWRRFVLFRLDLFQSITNLSKQILEQYFIQSEQNGGKIVTI